MLAVLCASSLGYSGLLGAPRRTLPTKDPFSALALTPHPTCLEENEPVVAEAMSPRLDALAPEKAMPKLREPPADAVDPIADLWRVGPNGPKGPKGPSVFKLNQGRAIDILRADYPRLLTQKPDLSIFAPELELHDPSGKRLTGLRQYERVFDMLRFLRRTTMQDAQVTYRLVVQDERIRVRWSAKLWMRDPALGMTKLPNGEQALVHLDGVSNYDLDKEGKIRKHTLENIVMRGQEDMPAINLGFAWPTPQLATPAQAMPFFRSLFDALPEPERKQLPTPPTRHATARQRRSPPPQASAAGETPLERAARERAEDEAKAKQLAELRQPRVNGRAAEGNGDGGKGSFLSAMKKTLPQPCETSYDCERPEVCCDLLFGTICCSGGMMIPTVDGPQMGLQPQAIPIPVEADNGPPMPPQGGQLPY